MGTVRTKHVSPAFDMSFCVQNVLGSGAAGERFGREFIAGINHVNYNQNNSLNALAGQLLTLPRQISYTFSCSLILDSNGLRAKHYSDCLTKTS